MVVSFSKYFLSLREKMNHRLLMGEGILALFKRVFLWVRERQISVSLGSFTKVCVESWPISPVR